MHKTLKGSNEVTALLFVGAAEDEAAVRGVAPIHPALKGLVSQFEDWGWQMRQPRFKGRCSPPWGT